MLKKILVAIDRSPMGREVFNQALSLAKATGGSIMLLHILSYDDKGSPVMLANYPYFDVGMNDAARQLYQEQWREFENQGLGMLNRFADEAKVAGVEVELTQIPGSPSSSICQVAKNWEADLIVMGRRGFSGFKELILGSVSNYVLHHAPCSVFIHHHEEVKDTQVSSHSEVRNQKSEIRSQKSEVKN